MIKHLSQLHVAKPLNAEAVIIVFGGASFLGTYLCEHLLNQCHVVSLDSPDVNKKEAPLPAHKKLTFIKYDSTRPITDVIRKRVTHVFHVAYVDEGMRTKGASTDELLLSTSAMRSLLDKALADKAKFLLVLPFNHKGSIGESFSERLTIQYREKFGLNERVIRVGQLFGPHMPLKRQDPLAYMIEHLLIQGKAKLAVSQLSRVYPIFVRDAVDRILRIMFSSASQGKIFNLMPSQSVSVLELSEILKSIDPSYELMFAPNDENQKAFKKEQFYQGITLRVGEVDMLAHQIRQTLEFFKNNLSSQVEKDKRSKRKREVRTILKSHPIASFSLWLALFSTVLPFLLLLITSLVGIVKLSQSQQAIVAGQFEKSVKEALFARQFFTVAQKGLQVISYHPLLLLRHQEKDTLFLLLRAADDASLTFLDIANVGYSLETFFQKSIAGEGDSARSVLNQGISQLNTVAMMIAVVEKDFKDISSRPLPVAFTQYMRGKQAILVEYKETLSVIQTLVQLLPDILGVPDKRVYALLFQNNMELRPGGGFIGSYGIVTFEQGNLISFDVFDVYSADGQLTGHIDPPAPIRNILGQPNWFLRDSNWDPDFQNSAAAAAWFLQKEVGVSLDGVIGVDVTFIKYLLEALGPMPLPDYQETITAENLFDKAQTHTEKDFFPGSTQKRDFLGTLARRIVDRLQSDNDVHWLSVLSAITNGMRQKHVLFAFHNDNIQKVLNLNNWGGSLLAFDDVEGRFNDFRMISEANLGVNKANLLVARKIRDELFIGNEGEVVGKLAVAYVNGNEKTSGNSYVNYVRFLFPSQTKIAGIAIDGEDALRAGNETKGEKAKGQMSASGGIEFEGGQSAGKKIIFGFLLTIPAGATKEVTISYELSKPFSILPGSSTYAYAFQKQPGTEGDPLSVTIHYPQKLQLGRTNAQVFKEPQLVSLSTDLSEDRLFEVEFLQ